MYGPYHCALFELLYGRAPEGLASHIVDDAEERLGVRLPPPLRDYYLLFGGEDRLASAYNTILRPDLLQREDGRLIFCEENQGVCVWGCTPSGDDPDAEVANVLPDDLLEWHPEGSSVGSFLSVMILLQTAWGGFEFGGAMPWTQAALADAGVTWEHVVRHQELTIYVAEGTVVTAFDDDLGVTGAGRTAAHFERLRALASP